MSLLHDDVGSESESDQDAILIGRADVSDFNPSNILPEPAAVLHEITSWLKPTEYDHNGSEYQKHLSFHLAGTGDWVSSTAVYQQWHGGEDPGILWVRGAPGSGKSVLASTVIRKLSQEEWPVLYFFFRHTVSANHSAGAAVRDWLSQVLKFSPPLQVELKKRMESHDKEGGVETLALADLFGLLRMALSHLPKAYILVDALDEMDQETLEPFLGHFNELGKWRPVEVKLVMTSRPVAVVEKIVRGVKVLDVRLDKQRLESDIAAYVQHRLASSSIPADRRFRVAETIMDRCDGLFLYARLAMDHVLDRPHQELGDSLGAIPAGISVMYSNILEEQSKRSDIPAGLQQLVLKCVTHATRPLRLLEISELVNVTQDMGDLGTTKNLIRSVCGPLLEVLPDETVHVVHHSLTEFLNGTTRDSGHSTYPVFEPGPTHNGLALLCISYLRAGSLDHVEVQPAGLFDSARHLSSKQVLPAFTRYAALNWHVHARKAMLAGHDQSEVNSQVHEMFVGENLEKLGLLAGASEACGFTPLGLATSFKLTSFAREILTAAKLATEGQGDSKESALQYAAASGAVELIELLLEYGADPKKGNRDGDTPLHLAVSHNRHQATKALLDAGVDPFISQAEKKQRNMDVDVDSLSSLSEDEQIMVAITRPTFHSPTGYALRAGDLQMVSIFEPYLKTPEAANWALNHAVTEQRRDVMERILKHPMVDVNYKYCGCTPLYIACAHRDAVSINLLLMAGADPNIVHNNDDREVETGYNALHSLAGHGIPFSFYPVKPSGDVETKRCFKLVLEVGAKVDLVDINGSTPLHIAKDAVTVECLLDAGADPNATNRAGQTLLHATYNNDILRLLAPRVDINAKIPSYNITPLLYVLMERWINDDFKIKKASQLLDLGADATVVDGNGNGTLHHTVATHRLGDHGLLLLQRLYESGANVNLRNQKEETPLHWCLAGSGSNRYGVNDDLKVLKVLLAAGAELEAKDNKGQTPLFQMMASQSSYTTDEKIRLCEQMMAAGARIDTTDLEGRNLLHCVVQRRWTDANLLSFLISHGIDPQQTDKQGNTLWHLAGPEFAKLPPNLALISELVTVGVDPEKTNDRGQTPLHTISGFHPYPFRYCNSSSEGRRTNADNEAFFDHFVGLCKNIDCVDKDGVTPLHVASTFSEYLTRRLLEEGADPRKKTLEGLTPLHLAARSRQTNTLEILLSWLKAKVDEATASEILEARDRLSRSALYYACASGCVETVQILLNAGVAVDTESYAGSPWDGCVAFQDEEMTSKWRWSPSGLGGLDSEPDAAGVLISDKLRTKLDLEGGSYNSRFPFTMQRLDDITELLIVYGSASARHVNQAISLAVEQQFDHATECLLRARGHLGMTEAYKLDEETSARLSQRNEPPTASTNRQGGSIAVSLMGRRQYTLATIQILQNVESQLGEDKLHFDVLVPRDTMLHCLAANGFATMLDRVASFEAVQAIKIRDNWGPTPLLVEACRREWWNMTVVRLLVERKGADLNGIALSLRAPGYDHGFKGNGPRALHVLVRGGHWWQTNEALPYLLRQGADTEVRDERGITPLGAALEAINGPHFSKMAVETLLQFGADPNTADNQGRTCLSRAGGNRDVYELLIRHGATVSPSTMVDVLSRKDITLLEAILASGVDPNLRKPGKEIPARVSADGRSHYPHRSDPRETLEHYPLELVASQKGDDKRDKEVSEKMLRLLLDYGANPSARYERTTVMHRILQNNTLIEASIKGESKFLGILLQNKNLDMETTEDDFGMTLLLSACLREKGLAITAGSGKPTLVRMLLDAGADVRAKDNKDRTALHILLASRTYYRTTKIPDIGYIITAAPELVHAVDNEGRTPLHVALGQHMDTSHVDKLIRSGSDVLASVKSTGNTVLHLLFRHTWVISPHGQVRVEDTTDFAYGPMMDSDAIGSEQEEQNNLLRRFLAMGTDVNAWNDERETPIFSFFREGNVFAAALLPRQIGWKTMQQTSDDMYARQEAERRVSVEKEHLVWQLFDDIGVDWKVANGKGETLMHVVAAYVSSDEIGSSRRVARFKFLVGKGLDPMQEDENHRTPLDVAAALGQEDILALFKRTDRCDMPVNP